MPVGASVIVPWNLFSERAAQLALAAALLCVNVVTSVTTWNATSDFGIGNGNPTGPFTYAYLLSLPPPAPQNQTGNIILLEVPETMPGVGVGWLASNTSAPYVMQMLAPVNGTEAGQLVMHPGCDRAETAAVLWTAPANGSYLIDVTFGTGDVGSTTVSVFLDNVTLLSPQPLATQPVRYFGVVRVAAGASVYSCVGVDQSCEGSLTPVDFTVTRVLHGWDATQDFSGSDNPAGPFSYGYFDTLPPAPMHRFDVPTSQPDVWISSVTNTYGTPLLMLKEPYNYVGKPFANVYVGQIMVHPGCGHGEAAALQWCAPFRGTFRILAWFGHGDFGVTTGYVYVNTTQVFAAEISALDVAPAPMRLTLDLNQTVTLCVTAVKSCSGGGTPLMCVVTTDDDAVPPQKTSTRTKTKRTHSTGQTLSRSASTTDSGRRRPWSTATATRLLKRKTQLSTRALAKRHSSSHSKTNTGRRRGFVSTDAPSQLANIANQTVLPSTRISPPAQATAAPQFPGLGFDSAVANSITVTAYGSAAVASALSPTLGSKPGVTSRVVAGGQCQRLIGAQEPPPTPNAIALFPAWLPLTSTDAASMAATTMLLVAVTLLFNLMVARQPI